MTEAGLPGERIHLKPNFLDPDPGPGTGAGGFAMYLGRLSPEKKVDTMLDAWERLDQPVPLKISGDGPLRPQVEAAAARIDEHRLSGFRPTRRGQPSARRGRVPCLHVGNLRSAASHDPRELRPRNAGHRGTDRMRCRA